MPAEASAAHACPPMIRQTAAPSKRHATSIMRFCAIMERRVRSNYYYIRVCMASFKNQPVPRTNGDIEELDVWGFVFLRVSVGNLGVSRAGTSLVFSVGAIF